MWSQPLTKADPPLSERRRTRLDPRLRVEGDRVPTVCEYLATCRRHAGVPVIATLDRLAPKVAPPAEPAFTACDRPDARRQSLA